jgi:hypothetical protein
MLSLPCTSCTRSNQGSIKSALGGVAAKKVKDRIDDIQKKVSRHLHTPHVNTQCLHALSEQAKFASLVAPPPASTCQGSSPFPLESLALARRHALCTICAGGSGGKEGQGQDRRHTQEGEARTSAVFAASRPVTLLVKQLTSRRR